MAMELDTIIPTNHEDCILALAYNHSKREVFSSGQGGKEIHVWDARNGKLLRRQSGHKGCVTGLAFDELTRVLFSVSLDGCIALWCDRGSLLHVFTAGVPLFSIALRSDHGFLAAGGHKTLHLFNVLVDNILGLSHESRSVFVENVSNGVSAEDWTPNRDCNACVFERPCPVLKGPEFCQSDTVQTIKITDSGKIITGGFDGCLCFYEMEKPKESYRKIQKAHSTAISCLEFDEDQNLVLTGGYDGCFKIWSNEGKCIEVFENISDAAVVATCLPASKEYWIVGKGGQVIVVDSKGPTDITDYVCGTKGLRNNSGKPLSLSLLHSPPDTKILLCATNNKSIVLWKYDDTREYRIFRNPAKTSIECLVPVQTKDEVSGLIGSEILTGDSRGIVRCWKEETDKCSDVFKIQNNYSLHKTNALCIAYVHPIDVFVSGGDDGSIVVFQTRLKDDFKRANQTILATFDDHNDKVTSLAVIDDFVVSGSYDRSIRVWDVKTLRAVQVIPQAHSTAIQCLDYSAETHTLSSCAMNHVVKIWSANHQKELSLLRVLNHRIPHATKSHDRVTKETHITTTSKIDGDLAFDKEEGCDEINVVEQAILHADVDVPEVTQVRWVSHNQCWITAANDDVIRLWDAQGTLLRAFPYKGGPVQCIFVDDVNKRILLSTLDTTVSVMRVDHPVPITTFHGHDDIVRCISYLPERDLYITGSWDGSLRLWHPFSTQTSETIKTQTTSKTSIVKTESEIPCSFIEPTFLNADYSQLWKTIALMEEYENKHTTKRSGDEPLVAPDPPQGQGPILLDKLLDDIAQRGLDQILNKSQPKTPKNTFKKASTFLKSMSTKRRN